MSLGIIIGVIFGKIFNEIIISLDYKYLSKFPEVLIIGWLELLTIICLFLISFIFYLFSARNFYKNMTFSESLRAENK